MYGLFNYNEILYYFASLLREIANHLSKDADREFNQMLGEIRYEAFSILKSARQYTNNFI